MRIGYFTAGNWGAGHLVRGLAIGRGLKRAGMDAEFRLFGPELPYAVAARPDYTVVPIDARELRDPARARASVLARTLREFEPDLLLVDCYWAPLRFVLPLSGCEPWLLLRWLPLVWFRGPLGAPYAPEQYARRLAIEPWNAPSQTGALPPIVICNPDEARPRGSLRARLSVSDSERLVVLAHAGVKGEAERMAAPQARLLSLHDADAVFPLAEWLGDSDEVFCAAGYNSYWEARWMGTEDRTRFSVLERQRAEQSWRVSACAGLPMNENGADVLAREIADHRAR